MLSIKLDDPWKELRADLFGNIEPEIHLVGITMPVVHDFYMPGPEPPEVDECETMPAEAASISYGSFDKVSKDWDKAIRLNEKLIELDHDTPLEAVQFNFHVTGISKACGAQMSRHRIGQGHISSSRRYQKQAVAFVYPLLNYLAESDAKAVYATFEKCYMEAIWLYNELKDEHALSKEDRRRVIPVASAQERMWFINARALRYFLRQRLAPDAEWEIRRIAIMTYQLVSNIAPSLFCDLLS